MSLVSALEPVVENARRVTWFCPGMNEQHSTASSPSARKGAASRLELASVVVQFAWQAVISSSLESIRARDSQRSLDESDATLLAAEPNAHARDQCLGPGRLRHEGLRRMLVAASSKSKNLLVPLFLCRALERSLRHWRESCSAVCDENCFFCCPAVMRRSAARLIAVGMELVPRCMSVIGRHGS